MAEIIAKKAVAKKVSGHINKLEAEITAMIILQVSPESREVSSQGSYVDPKSYEHEESDPLRLL
eukprot:CAMPEP_0113552396 /NCGR_PEP_ID=MMETSP0015_2-20120614/15045_1 /TAXON_ID=2838 /ORGANISM="Odontella" /LENGTH=63 /DNA_ID=CAMNT_0000453371 /DNA_START=70 /DNA_END=261 /DNA_ORIENTATION=+ /assembly_acc=CAM_ASM_000160